MAKRKADALGPQTNMPSKKKLTTQVPATHRTVEERLELNKSKARNFATVLAARAQEEGIFHGNCVPFEIQDDVLAAYKRARGGKPLNLAGLKTRYHPITGEQLYSRPEKHAAKLARKNPQKAEQYLARVKSIAAEVEQAREALHASGLLPIQNDFAARNKALNHSTTQLVQNHEEQENPGEVSSDEMSIRNDDLESDLSETNSIDHPVPQPSPRKNFKHDFAERTMAKMGYKKGSGLGKDAAGITKPIEVKVRPKLAGIGADSFSIEAAATAKAAKQLYEATRQEVAKQSQSGFNNVHCNGKAPHFGPIADPFAGLRQGGECGDSISFDDSCNDSADEAQVSTAFEDTLPSQPESLEKCTSRDSSDQGLGLISPTKSRPKRLGKRQRERQRLLDSQTSTYHILLSTKAKGKQSRTTESTTDQNTDFSSDATVISHHEPVHNQPEQSELIGLARAIITRQEATLVPKVMSALQLRASSIMDTASQKSDSLPWLPIDFFAAKDLQPLGPNVVIDDELLVRSGTSRSEIQEELLRQRENLAAALLHSAKRMTKEHLVLPQHKIREQKHLLSNGLIKDTHRMLKTRLICHRLELVLNGIDPTAFAPWTGPPDKDIKYSDGTQYAHLSRRHAKRINWQPVGASQTQAQLAAPTSEQMTADLTNKFGGLWYPSPPAHQARATTPKLPQQTQSPASVQQSQVTSHGEQTKSSSTVYSQIYGNSQPPTAVVSSTLFTNQQAKWVPPHLRDKVPPINPSANWAPPFSMGTALPTGSPNKWIPPQLRGTPPLVPPIPTWTPPYLSGIPLRYADLRMYSTPPPMNDRQAAAVRQWCRPDACPVLPTPSPTREYITSASLKALRCDGKKPLLIICDLNGTLLFRNRLYKSNFKKRPGLTRFLDYIFANHKVIVWTSARPHNMLRITDKLFTPEQQSACVKLWARDTLGLTPAQYEANPQVYKRLETVWQDESVQRTHPGYADGGRWSQKNTIIIDDSPLKTIAQPHNAINVPELVPELLEMEEKTALLRQVEVYIEEACHYDNISAFMRAEPFIADGRWWKAGNNTMLAREESVQVEESEDSPRH